MSGKIDSEGTLHLNRRGHMKQQCCPHQKDTACGDWCPFMEEPRDNRLTICHGTLLLGIADERREFGTRTPTAQERIIQKPPKATTEEVLARKGGARPGSGRKKKYWGKQAKDDKLLVCPECFTRASAASEPTHCSQCKTRLHLPEN